MKKSVLLFCAVALLSFKANDVKQFNVKGTKSDWDNVIYVIEQSNAPHLQVREAQEFILKQLNVQLKQVMDSVRSKQDSIKTKK